MAVTVQITLAPVEVTSPFVPVIQGVAGSAQRLTTNGSNQISAVEADQSPETVMVWVITTTGGNIDVDFGPSPNAATSPKWLVLDGTTREFSVSALGEKVAIKGAA